MGKARAGVDHAGFAKRHRLVGALVALTVGGAAYAQGEALHRYEVRVAPDLERLEVHACVVGAARGASLATGSSAARDFLINSRTQGVALRSTGELTLATPTGDGPQCFDYAVSLSKAIGANNSRLASRYGSDLVTRSTLWLWRPREMAANEDIEIRFHLPPDMNVSVPWRPTGRAHTYRVGKTSRYWPARTAFGRFETIALEVPGARLRLAALAGTDAAKMTRWLREAATSVTTLYGRFPVTDGQVLAVPYGRGNEAVPWAQIVRGGGNAALFFVDASRPLEEFRSDWTATHEFSHLLLPYLHRDDAWLSEGLASYYQEVLRARAGLLHERRAWERLEAGFDRGRAQGHQSTLAYLSQHMGRERAHRHVYWSGAAYWLEVDVALRRQGDTLDRILDELRACCLPAEDLWYGDQLLRRLDQLSGAATFTSIAARYAKQRGFPDLSKVFSTLGVEVIGRDRVRFDDTVPGAAIRRAIMASPAPQG